MALAALVTKEEAVTFQQFAELSKFGNAFKLRAEDRVLKTIQETVRKALAINDVTVSIKGSCAAGTNSAFSDVDIDIATPGRKITLQDKRTFMTELQRTGLVHEKHVSLKRVAIGCSIQGIDVDLVFAQSLERAEGEYQSLAERFEGNVTAQHAARVMKIVLKRTLVPARPTKLPAFVLNLLILRVQDQDRNLGELAQGPMQLFCATLQQLADCPEMLQQYCSKCRNEAFCSLCTWFTPESSEKNLVEVGQAKRESISRHARAMLRIFCLSRIYFPGGFISMLNMERWIRGVCITQQPTMHGPVPFWMFGIIEKDETAVSYIHLGLSCLGPRTQGYPLSGKIDWDFEAPLGPIKKYLRLELRSGCPTPKPLWQNSASPTLVLEQLACWSRVRHKNAVVVVDPHRNIGNCDTVASLDEAMLAIRQKCQHLQHASIIVMDGEHCVGQPLIVRGGLQLDIHGEGNAVHITTSLQAQAAGHRLTWDTLSLLCLGYSPLEVDGIWVYGDLIITYPKQNILSTQIGLYSPKPSTICWMGLDSFLGETLLQWQVFQRS